MTDLNPNAPRLIGLCGLAGSGKSAVAEILAQYGYERLRFAAPLKTMIRALLIANGVEDIETLGRMIEGDLKGEPHPALGGRTPRHAMQTLGTEWGRQNMAPDFWVAPVMHRAELILARGGRVVIEDVRFENEAAPFNGCEAASARGERELWMVTGRGGIQGDHASESDPARLLPDLVLHNTGTMDRLERLVLEEILG